MSERRDWTRVVARMAGGEQAALAELYDGTNSLLYGTALRYLGDPADAEEAVLDAYLQAWRTAARFDASRASVVTWLLMLVRSRSLDRLRARVARERVETAGLEGVEELRPARDLGSDKGAAERRRVMEDALAALPTAQREVLRLALFSGLSQSEVAVQLTTPLGTVKTRMRQGLIRVRDHLKARFGSDEAIRVQLSA